MKPNLRLKRERERRGLSQARLAEEVGTTDRNISRWERGFSSPHPYYREKLCAFFGRTVQELGLVEEDELEHNDSSSSEPSERLQGALHDPTIPHALYEESELVGRDQVLHLLRQRLCLRKNVALYGLPGVGKTTLATALAHDSKVQATFCDGILWAGLGPRANVLGHLSRWETLLELSSTEAANANSTEERVVALRAAIGERRMLLVIDDTWEIEAALNFKVGGPNCALLVTTRFPRIALRFAGDGATALRELNREDGLTLLARLAPEIVNYDRHEAETLVQEGGGLPLALTLMGKYLQTQAYDGQPRRMRAAIERLRDAAHRLHLSEPQAPPERSPSLSAETSLSLQSAISVSDQHLDEQARTALRALAVFPAKPNSFPEEAAVAVAQLPVEVLDILADAGLLESGGPGRYMLHQTIADYAKANMGETIASDRMIAYMVNFVETHASNDEALERESNNILAALLQAFAAGLQAKFVRGVNAFAPFLLSRGLYDLARLHLQRAYHTALWQRDTSSSATTLLYLGQIALRQGEYSQAEVYLRDGLTHAREAESYKHLCHLFTALTTVALHQESYEQAEKYAHEGLALARQHEEHECLNDLLNSLAQIVAKQG